MITKIDLRPYRHKPDTWEADVTMLVQGQEVRRRWKSPMPSRLASERWAREKALGFLARGAKPKKAIEEPPKKEIPTLTKFADLWVERYVVAQDVGFGDPERMRRAFVRAFGQPPQALRRLAKAETERVQMAAE